VYFAFLYADCPPPFQGLRAGGAWSDYRFKYTGILFLVGVMFKVFRCVFVFMIIACNAFAVDGAGNEKALDGAPKGDVYIKKPAVNAAYDVAVIGDSLGSGLWQGLYQNFQNSEKQEVNFVRLAKTNTGIVRDDRYDWPREVEALVKEQDFQIAVMMFGANDAQSIRAGGKRYHFKTPGWEQRYRERIDRMINALMKRDIAVYWVGLPNVEKPELREDYLHVNAIFKERASEHGVRFIDTWDVTNDEKGDYQAIGESVDGRRTILRAKDGTHFTPEGYRNLARYAEERMRQDMAQAGIVVRADGSEKAIR